MSYGDHSMNDFTKEELSMLQNGVQYLSDRTSLSDGYLATHNALETKIQSMIDNYCEHTKNVWPLYTPTGDIPVAGLCYECNQPVDREFISD